MSDDRLETLRRSWSYIVTWCEAHAPVTAVAFQLGAEEAALTAAQERTGQQWPEQLLAWLRLADGVDRSFDAVILPAGFAPLGVEHIVGSWEMMTTITADVYPAEEVTAAETEQAGSRSSAFLRSRQLWLRWKSKSLRWELLDKASDSRVQVIFQRTTPVHFPQRP